MKLKIYSSSNHTYHYITGTFTGEKSDINIAEFLGLAHKEYHEILLAHGAYICDSSNNVNCNFKNKSNAVAVLKALEPRIIMQSLVGDM